jgi:hypothetical protein
MRLSPRERPYRGSAAAQSRVRSFADPDTVMAKMRDFPAKIR